LFTDLVGFTSRAEELDPEDVRALLTPYYARLREQIEQRGGTVEKFIGDAVMAVFGAPVAHEDDPVRAVLTAIAIRDGSPDVEQTHRSELVGRERELFLLTDAFQRSKGEETAQLVTLVGVPGIGKSRLVAELFSVLDADPDVYWWRQGRSLPYGESRSVWALGEI